MLYCASEVMSLQKRILIIEDEKSIRNILKAFLEDIGYQVKLAADGMRNRK